MHFKNALKLCLTDLMEDFKPNKSSIAPIVAISFLYFMLKMKCKAMNPETACNTGVPSKIVIPSAINLIVNFPFVENFPRLSIISIGDILLVSGTATYNVYNI